MKISKSQENALKIVMELLDSKSPNKKEYILTLIYGILNLELEEDKTIAINPNIDNDKLHIINIPDPIQPLTPQIWYNQEPEPIQTDAHEEVRYVTSVTNTDDKNSIVYTTNASDIQ